MDINILCEAMLVLYKDLNKLCKNIDEQVEKIAVKSINIDVLDGFKKITDLTQKKVQLCNIKVLIDEALQDLKDQEKDLLVYKYIKRLSMEDIIAKLEISDRTYFRKKEKQINAIKCQILKRYTESELICEYATNKTTMGVYKVLAKRKEAYGQSS